MKEIGGSGQKKLLQSTVAMVGAGGLGSVVLLYLAAAGIGKLKILDNDVVSLSNLQRQILFRNGDLGQKKVVAAKKNLLALNPNLDIEIFDEGFNGGSDTEFFKNCDLLVDGTDNYKSKVALSHEARRLEIPLVFGGLSKWDGQMSVFDPTLPSACFGCIFPEPPSYPEEEDCSGVGIVGPVVGIVGSLMAAEVVKWLIGAGNSYINNLFTFDSLNGEVRKFEIQKREDCKVCKIEP